MMDIAEQSLECSLDENHFCMIFFCSIRSHKNAMKFETIEWRRR